MSFLLAQPPETRRHSTPEKPRRTGETYAGRKSAPNVTPSRPRRSPQLVRQLGPGDLRTHSPSSFKTPTPTGESHNYFSRRSLYGSSTKSDASRIAEVNAEHDNVARACGQTPSPPSRFLPERYRERGPSPLRISPPAPPRPSEVEPVTEYNRLHEMLFNDNLAGARFDMRDHLALSDLSALHTRDRIRRNERERKRDKTRVGTRRESFDPCRKVVGIPLDDVLLHAARTTTMGGNTYDIPILVHACVKALRRTGMYVPGLFKDFPNPPDRQNCDKLVAEYNRSPMWGDHYALEKEPVSDICFLLITFLSGLNEPLMDPTITLPFYKWVVEPSSRRDHEARTRIAKQMKEDLEDRTHRGADIYVHPDDIEIPWTKADLQRLAVLEKPQIAIAVVLLRLLPLAHFSLLVYLLRFFSELTVYPENGMSVKESVRLWADKLIGPTEGTVVLQWLLSRWDRLSEALFVDSREAYKALVERCGCDASMAATPILHSSTFLATSARTPDTPTHIIQRSSTVSSLRSRESDATDPISLRRHKSNSLYRSSTNESHASSTSRQSARSTNTEPRIETQHPDFAQTPVICGQAGTPFESDRLSVVSEAASISVYSNDEDVEQENPQRAVRSVERMEKSPSGNAAYEEALQTISDRDITISRLKRELAKVAQAAESQRQTIADIREDVKNTESKLVEKVNYAEGMCKEYRELIASNLRGR